LTRRVLSAVICIAIASLVTTATPRVGLAANSQNFTGKYLHRGEKDRSDLDPPVTLDVVQNEGTITITRVDPGGKTSNLYPLNGAEEDCVNPSGVSAKCKAQLKGKSLILETTVASRDQKSGALFRIRTVEQWQLSGDSKTLTIKLHVEFPDSHSSNLSSEGQSLDADRYIRQ
jgi:hypothetical protein